MIQCKWMRWGLPLVLILALPLSAQGQIQKTFDLTGFGGYLLEPAWYDGQIIGGTLAPAGGFFFVAIDDAGWPQDDPGTPLVNERMDYIYSEFFEYVPDAGGEHWDGYFPKQGSNSPVVEWRFFVDGDRVGGVVRLIISITDSNHNGVMDPDELALQAVSGNMVGHIEQSTGQFLGLCASGTMNGTLEGLDPMQPYVITVNAGSLFLRDFGCAVANEASTWGAIKSIFSDDYDEYND